MAEAPDIVLAGFSLWIRGRAYPNSDDYWDGNWLDVGACVVAHGARVEAEGCFLTSTDIAHFLTQLEALYRDLSGTAVLENYEPNIRVTMVGDRLGHIKLTVHLTPDFTTQAHRFDFELDQTVLPLIMADCRRVMERFPIKGSPLA
jgi:hypothetical protein